MRFFLSFSRTPEVQIVKTRWRPGCMGTSRADQKEARAMHGDDPHFSFGKEQAYPGDNFDYHVIPFVEAAVWGVEDFSSAERLKKVMNIVLAKGA